MPDGDVIDEFLPPDSRVLGQTSQSRSGLGGPELVTFTQHSHPSGESVCPADLYHRELIAGVSGSWLVGADHSDVYRPTERISIALSLGKPKPGAVLRGQVLEVKIQTPQTSHIEKEWSYVVECVPFSA